MRTIWRISSRRRLESNYPKWLHGNYRNRRRVHRIRDLWKRSAAAIPFALQVSAVPEEAPGCVAKALPAWSWHRAYRDVFTASFDGHPGAEF
ncbi:hypothetical protein EQU24_20555 [Methylotuvimicrobium buryatense]|uniref:Uncharacterized protein n=1 Tax=Methylotuvimicrobium buryatense TaxID=95641 RepID=A0A4P9UX23_METBY|nr:hypothetical protein EQU24_20555 [Methylotuvimicrobium buryatense]